MRRVMKILLVAAVVFGIWSVRSSAGPQAVQDPGCVAGDVNDDARLDLADAVHILEHLFNGGPGPREACAQVPMFPLDEADVDRLRELLAAEAERDFGRRFAGLWSFGVPGATPVILGAVSADGIVNHVDDNDFAVNTNTRFHTSAVGVWERVGDRGIRTTSMAYTFTGNGDLFMLYKATGSFTINEDFDEVTGEYCEEWFGPGVDPIDGEPFRVRDGIPAFGRRMTGGQCLE